LNGLCAFQNDIKAITNFDDSFAHLERPPTIVECGLTFLHPFRELLSNRLAILVLLKDLIPCGNYLLDNLG
jgi:hypothetical protein